MTDDAELLRRYANENSQAAFTELVHRHVDLVYSVALRRTNGDAHRAADVAQQVFTALARAAQKLSRHEVLSAWLHTATRNAAINLMISEQRRKTRETEAMALEPIHSNDTMNADWERLQPLLDTAIDELSRKDRDVVVLRFLEKRAFSDIGQVLNISEDAARMRTDRALEKLRQRLAHHGITSTAAAISLIVSSQPIIAAPAGLAASLASNTLAIAGASTGVLATLIAIITAKAFLAITLLALIAGTSLTWNSHHQNVKLLNNDKATATLSAPLDSDKTAATNHLNSLTQSTATTTPPPPSTPDAELVECTKEIITKDHTYYDKDYNVLAKYPDKWRLMKAEHYGQKETYVFFNDPDHPKARPNIYYRIFDEPRQQTPKQIAGSLIKAAEAKTRERLNEGFTDYDAGALVPRIINERPALTWTGSFIQDGEPWAEYLTRIYSPNGTILFNLRAPADELPSMLKDYESMIQRTIIP